MSDTQLFIQNQQTTLAGAGASLGDTSVVLTSLTQNDGTLIAMTDVGTKGFATIEPGNGSQEESITFSGITQNANGTATLTGVKTALTVAPYTETSGLAITHAGGTTLILSNTAAFYNALSGKGNDETITGKWTFPGDATNRPTASTDLDSTTDTDFITRGQLARTAVASAVAATPSTVGYSKLSSTSGTPTAPVVVETADTRVPTQGENDGLVGNNTDVAVGTGNKFVTQTGLQHSAEVYAASASGNDTYAVTLSPIPTSYTAGMTIRFKPDAANTGACTLNVNGLGAKSIYKNYNAELADNDIVASQVVTVTYDGTAFQLSANNFITKAQGTTLTGGTSADSLHTHVLGFDSVLRGYDVLFINSIGKLTKVDVGGTGGVTETDIDTTVYCGNSNTNHTYAHFDSLGEIGTPFNASKQGVLQFTAKNTAGTGDAYIGVFNAVTDIPSGGVLTTHHFGFIFVSGACWASNADGSTQTKTDISGSITEANVNNYIIIRKASSIEFYVNATLLATHTTNLPTSATLFIVGAKNTNNSAPKLSIITPFIYTRKV